MARRIQLSQVLEEHPPPGKMSTQSHQRLGLPEDRSESLGRGRDKRSRVLETLTGDPGSRKTSVGKSVHHSCGLK